MVLTVVVEALEGMVEAGEGASQLDERGLAALIGVADSEVVAERFVSVRL
jgi:hypothetical protein